MSGPVEVDLTDVANEQLVGADGLGEITIAMPRLRMSRAEALKHAAWLVALADDPVDPKFPAVLDAVRRT